MRALSSCHPLLKLVTNDARYKHYENSIVRYFYRVQPGPTHELGEYYLLMVHKLMDILSVLKWF